MRPVTGALFFLFLTFSAGQARSQDDANRFRWQKDQVFRYRVDHKTLANDSKGDVQNEVQTQINLVREWKVLEVDPKGTARVQLRLLSLKSVTKKPDGEILSFDSEKPADSTPQLRDQLTKFIGEPIALLLVDSQGKVTQVVESRFGSPVRFETDPPFGLVLSGSPIKTGDTWERAVSFATNANQLTSDGLKLEAKLKASCISANASSTTVRIKGEFTKLPETPAERIPLLQYFPDTEVVLDTPGLPPKLIVSKIDRSLKYGDKDASSYRLISEYRETRIDD